MSRDMGRDRTQEVVGSIPISSTNPNSACRLCGAFLSTRPEAVLSRTTTFATPFVPRPIPSDCVRHEGAQLRQNATGGQCRPYLGRGDT
jgi:hypothetical protein